MHRTVGKGKIGSARVLRLEAVADVPVPWIERVVRGIAAPKCIVVKRPTRIVQWRQSAGFHVARIHRIPAAPVPWVTAVGGGPCCTVHLGHAAVGQELTQEECVRSPVRAIRDSYFWARGRSPFV